MISICFEGTNDGICAKGDVTSLRGCAEMRAHIKSAIGGVEDNSGGLGGLAAVGRKMSNT